MRPWENFSLMVVLGLLAGLATGGPPAEYAGEVSTAALVFAMTFSLTEVRLLGLSVREESRWFLRALVLNYGALSGLILVLALFNTDPAIRYGWIVMAAVPSAIAVIPITSLFRGNVQRALVSSALLYLAALGLAPLVTLVFAGGAASPVDLGIQLLLQIAIPLAVSQALARVGAVARHRRTLVNLSFFALVLTLTGANRSVLVGSPTLVAALAVGAFVRTWGIGAVVYAISRRASSDRATHVADALFSSLKNLGFAAVLGVSLFGAPAALPAIVSIFLEISWVVALGSRFP